MLRIVSSGGFGDVGVRYIRLRRFAGGVRRCCNFVFSLCLAGANPGRGGGSGCDAVLKCGQRTSGVRMTAIGRRGKQCLGFIVVLFCPFA